MMETPLAQQDPEIAEIMVWNILLGLGVSVLIICSARRFSVSASPSS